MNRKPERFWIFLLFYWQVNMTMKYKHILVKCSLYFLPPPTFALATPRTFFCLFFLSLRCFLPIFLISNKPCYKKRAPDIQNKNLQHLISFIEQNTHITVLHTEVSLTVNQTYYYELLQLLDSPFSEKTEVHYK